MYTALAPGIRLVEGFAQTMGVPLVANKCWDMNTDCYIVLKKDVEYLIVGLHAISSLDLFVA